MAILRLKEIRAMQQEEMDKKLSELRLELSKMRGSAAVGAAIQNPGKAREIRKTIARILTIGTLAKHKASQRPVHGNPGFPLKDQPEKKPVQGKKKQAKGGER